MRRLVRGSVGIGPTAELEHEFYSVRPFALPSFLCYVTLRADAEPCFSKLSDLSDLSDIYRASIGDFI